MEWGSSVTWYARSCIWPYFCRVYGSMCDLLLSWLGQKGSNKLHPPIYLHSLWILHPLSYLCCIPKQRGAISSRSNHWCYHCLDSLCLHDKDWLYSMRRLLRDSQHGYVHTHPEHDVLLVRYVVASTRVCSTCHILWSLPNLWYTDDCRRSQVWTQPWWLHHWSPDPLHRHNHDLLGTPQAFWK